MMQAALQDCRRICKDLAFIFRRLVDAESTLIKELYDVICSIMKIGLIRVQLTEMPK